MKTYIIVYDSDQEPMPGAYASQEIIQIANFLHETTREIYKEEAFWTVDRGIGVMEPVTVEQLEELNGLRENMHRSNEILLMSSDDMLEPIEQLIYQMNAWTEAHNPDKGTWFGLIVQD